jgi:hypothetical protein
MSLTLARLCGEWRQIIQDMNNLLAEQIIQDMNNLLKESHWRNRKAVEEIGKPLKNIFSDFFESGKPLKKAESRWRNRKAVEEDFLKFLGNWKAVEENWILCEKNRSLGEEKFQFSQDILQFLAILGSRFDTKFATMCAHGFTWLVFQFFNCL